MPHKAFITNNKTKTLKKRLTELVEHSEELKFLVGFFYLSGWSQIYNSLKDRDDLEIKVLVGLSVDKKLYNILEYARESDNLTGEEKADDFFESLRIAINWSISVNIATLIAFAGGRVIVRTPIAPSCSYLINLKSIRYHGEISFPHF